MRKGARRIDAGQPAVLELDGADGIVHVLVLRQLGMHEAAARGVDPAGTRCLPLAVGQKPARQVDVMDVAIHDEATR